MTLAGIDISAHQASTPPLTGIQFAFARATYGTFADRLYPTHSSAIVHAGLVLGAYHFGRTASRGGPIADQVAAFLKAAGPTRLLVLDLEGDGRYADGRPRPSMTQAEARDFIVRCHGAGRRIGLYHSLSGFPRLGQDFAWIARWSTTPPPAPWAFWQYQGSPLDRDRFSGTIAELHALAGIPTPAPTVTLRYAAHRLTRPRRYRVAYDRTRLRSRPVRNPNSVARLVDAGYLFDAYQVVDNATGRWVGNRDGNRWLMYAGVRFVKYL